MKQPLNSVSLSHSLFVSALLYALTVLCNLALANDATIVDVKILASGGDNSFRIDVTLQHADEGWDHFANRWDVLNENGDLLGSRTLHHPHVNEQPFTRSLMLIIPESVKQVTIVASDSVHGDNSETLSVEVPGRN